MKPCCILWGVILFSSIHLPAQEPGDAGSAAVPVDSQPASTNSTQVDSAIAAKEAEIARLKKQLEQAKSEIQALHKQNQTLQTSDTTLKTQIQASGAPLPRPAPAPLTGAPPASAPMAAPDLFWYFHNSPDAANQYLKGKRITITGRLIGFEPPVVSHVFGIQLDSGDVNLRVISQFRIPHAYSAVVFERRTGTIMGRTSAGGEDPLLKINDQITVEGECRGLEDGDVLLANCRLIL
jgi:hypothetical protein